MVRFDQFFRLATGLRHDPYPYQCRLACGPPPPGANQDMVHPDAATQAWLEAGSPCVSTLITVPTGLGKTAAAVLAWLWNRLRSLQSSHRDSKTQTQLPTWPRRLVYCLPMRALVEQTADQVTQWLQNLRTAAVSRELDLTEQALSELLWLAGSDGLGESQVSSLRSEIHFDLGKAHSPIILMGGEEVDLARCDWDLFPEKPAILIGTQDMLLSRALNRGYGMSRYRWPMHFALLNNDCLWVMDETQLMGVGLETSAQLDAFRAALRTVNPCVTWWMSATLDEARLATVDHPQPAGGWPTVALDEADLKLPAVKARFRATKTIQPAGLSLSDATKKTYAAQLARFVVEHHHPDSLTLVVLNRVDRAQEVYQQVKELHPEATLALIHSRFRPGDRRAHEAVLRDEGSRIVIATQAVEAGVDVSARTLITELAPWPSLVQRFGRCNRHGEFQDGQARIFWVDVHTDANDDLAAPYAADELASARTALETLHDASPQSLRAVSIAQSEVIRPVLRRKDIIELFDTTPDLAGHDLDISRYIRDGEDTDVQVFWRDLNGAAPTPQEPQPTPDELCPVSLPRFRQFLQKLQKISAQTSAPASLAWVWDPLAETWQPAQVARPGATYLLDRSAGGYSTQLGWFGTASFAPDIAVRPPAPSLADRSYSADAASLIGRWITLADHAAHVAAQATALANELALELAALLPQTQPAAVLTAAARWHDLGKAHEAFQNMLRGDDPARSGQLWAKSANVAGRCERRFFRHELASALAWLQLAPPDEPERDLVAYLIAAHHGKVRLSIRSLPGEEPPPDRPDARIARGIVDGDTLPPQAFSAIGLNPPPQPVALSLEPMEMGLSPSGQPSWLARMLALRDRFGPFRLAWLETVLRVADARASMAEANLPQGTS